MTPNLRASLPPTTFYYLLRRVVAQLSLSEGMPTRVQQLGLLVLLTALVAYVWWRVAP